MSVNPDTILAEPTVRDLIVLEIERRLNEIDGIALVEVMPSGDPDAFPALAIYDDGQQPGEQETGTTRSDMDVKIEGYVESGSGPAALRALNTLYAQVVICLLTEPPLGGLAETIDEGGMRITVAELASKKRLGFGLEIPIQFATRRGNPALPA